MGDAADCHLIDHQLQLLGVTGIKLRDPVITCTEQSNHHAGSSYFVPHLTSSVHTIWNAILNCFSILIHIHSLQSDPIHLVFPRSILPDCDSHANAHANSHAHASILVLIQFDSPTTSAFRTIQTVILSEKDIQINWGAERNENA